MSTRRRNLDRHAAEQMLNGVPVAGGDPLTDLLAATAAPARDGELAGEHAAVAAFRAARLDTALQPRRPSMLTTLLAKLLAAKITAAAVVLAVAAGGIATAAATGYLPTRLGGNPATAPAHSVTSTTSATPSSARASDDHDATPSPGSPPPSPSLTGLCNAYTAGAGSEHGKALDSPAFRALVTAAGGKDEVDAYCANLHAGQQGEAGVTTTPPADTDVDHGGKGRGTNGPPSGHPSHPTGSPTTHPSH
jgi:hypothetical protein